MKTLAILLLGPCLAMAEPGGPLSWTYDPAKLIDVDPQGVSGFILYIGTTSQSYTESVEINPPYDLGDPEGNLLRIRKHLVKPGATYYLAVTAINALGIESDYSDEVVFRMPGRPGGPKIDKKK